MNSKPIAEVENFELLTQAEEEEAYDAALSKMEPLQRDYIEGMVDAIVDRVKSKRKGVRFSRWAALHLLRCMGTKEGLFRCDS